MPVRAELANGVMAIVDDAVITRDEVEGLIPESILRQFRSRPEQLQQSLLEARTNVLKKRIDRQLILHDFKTSGYNIPETILEDEVQNRIRTGFGDRQKLTKTLQAEGTTQEKFRQRIREQIIEEVLRHKNVSAEFIISPHKIEAFYQAHQEKFKVEDEVKLRMIMLNKSTDPDGPQTKKLGEEILAKLNEGVSFNEMEALYSQRSQRGQEAEWWQKSELRKELAEVAFSLKAGQRSSLVDTPEAFYLLSVEEARPAHIRALGEVRDVIQKELTQVEKRRLEDQ